jgi:hypothetical protein
LDGYMLLVQNPTKKNIAQWNVVIKRKVRNDGLV